LRNGVPSGETVETCTAGAGTLMLEFGLLGKLTGIEEFEVYIISLLESNLFKRVARTAMKTLWAYRSNLDLPGTIISVVDGKWSNGQSSIGAGVDSYPKIYSFGWCLLSRYFEYLLKAYILFGDEEFFIMFNKVNLIRDPSLLFRLIIL
jgi:mannosidase alpha-like ER degradation enhancer 1